ncbi:hypothetical protein H6G76_21590 [Nostoc sp. FACHB-152]|uniref:DUF6979 family protein n=1 Tax=unclassified Nostoc TaxID=2593658 RepID=UPI00168223F9|nr:MULTISPECIES: hypothetical protein [unclassified Nostoc]MBD2449712.1 hypothetical protein [Nostoc sp. FACHB-152]MBD2469068.1 hypothetical protein [Nostoc sp. FACHB-145]
MQRAKINYIKWITETINKMNTHQQEDPESWRKFWKESYEGISKYASKKSCRMCAAYGLWYLGYIVDGDRDFQDWELSKINHELGKNAVYAVIAIEKLDQQEDVSKKELWAYVQERYRQEKFPKKSKTKQAKSEAEFEEPADDDAGAIKIALVLFTNNRIVQLSKRK